MAYSCHVICILELAVNDFAVWNGPKHGVEVVSTVPKCKKAVLCLTEKLWELDKLWSGMGYSAVGREFDVNESPVYTKQGVFKQKRA